MGVMALTLCFQGIKLMSKVLTPEYNACLVDFLLGLARTENSY